MRTRRDAQKDEGQSGYGLVEMLVVLAIIATSLAGSLYMAGGFKRGQRAMDAAMQVEQAMRRARAAAVSTGQVQRISIDLVEPSAKLEGDEQLIVKDVKLAALVGRELAPSPAQVDILFWPDGHSTGLSLTLTGMRGNVARLDVNWLTGLTRIEDISGGK